MTLALKALLLLRLVDAILLAMVLICPVVQISFQQLVLLPHVSQMMRKRIATLMGVGTIFNFVHFFSSNHQVCVSVDTFEQSD